MARKVFYSFHYEKDINRTMIVRNRWLTYGNQLISGVIDKAEFEKIKRSGDKAIKDWIDKQLEGTTVTVILIGEDTLERPLVQYEIYKSVKRDNGIIGVHINNIKDMNILTTSKKGDENTVIYFNENNKPVTFSDIADGIYDYINDNGYDNLDKWVDKSAQNKYGL